MPRNSKKSYSPGSRQDEESLQSTILNWMEQHRPDLLCIHIPNGAIRTHRERRRMLEQGMVPGMPDLLLIDAEGRHGYMEVKTDRGALSMTQWDIREELVKRQVPWALVRSVGDVERTLTAWAWEAPTTLAEEESVLPDWPQRAETMPSLLRSAVTGLSWAEPVEISTMYGNNWARHLVPVPEEFRELWKEYKQDLKAAGIVLKRERNQGWIGIWYYYAKSENLGAASATTRKSPSSVP